MGLTFEPLGKFIHEVDVRNTDLSVTKLMGVNLSKQMMPSVANIIGTDLSAYKVVNKGQFACKLMSVGRDACLPIALKRDEESVIISSAYYAFEVNDESEMMSEYLMMCFLRPDFDRELWFRTGGDVRGGVTWDTFCEMPIPYIPISEQRKIVHDYQVITGRIELLQRMNNCLVDTVKTVYLEMFKGKEYPITTMADLCSKIGSGATPRGGKETYCDEGISLIRSTNVYDYFFSYDDLAHIDDYQADALSNVIVEPYDVLFNITGVSIARCCMVPEDVLPARVNQHVMILRPHAGKYMSYYLLMTLCDQTSKNLFFGIGQSGSTREAINKQEMEDFKISQPTEGEILTFGQKAEACFSLMKRNACEIKLLKSTQELLLTNISKGA